MAGVFTGRHDKKILSFKAGFFMCMQKGTRIYAPTIKKNHVNKM